MKKKQMSKKTRNIIIISALLVVLASGSAFAYYQFNKTSNDTPNYSSSDTPNKTPARFLDTNKIILKCIRKVKD